MDNLFTALAILIWMGLGATIGIAATAFCIVGKDDEPSAYAELFKLARIMAYCMQHERDCDGCRLNGADGTITAPVGCDGLLDRMRELEVAR